MVYSDLSRYNGFMNKSKEMGGNMAICVGV